MIRTNVKVFDRFPEVTADVERLARRALNAAAAEAARTAAEIGSARGMTDFDVKEAVGSATGYTSGIKGQQWYWRLQSFGTLGRAIRPKRPGHKRSHAPGTGITPNLMYQRARTAGRRKLVEIISRGP